MPSPAVDDSALVAFDIKVDGASLDAVSSGRVYEVAIDMALDGSDMIEVVFDDWELEELTETSQDFFGKEISVAFGYGNTTEVVAKGLIVSIEPDVQGNGRYRTTWRALSKLSVMGHGRKTRSYLNMKDSQIAQKLAQEIGLSTDIDVTDTTYEYVVQWNQSNLSFLQERARRIGYRIWSDGTKLYFKKDKNDQAAVATFTLGDNIIAFRTRATLAQQVAKVVVRGWNPGAKQTVVGQSAAPQDLAQGGMTTAPHSLVQSKLSASNDFTVIDHSVSVQADATAIAQGALNDFSRLFLEGEIDVQGNTLLRPGELIAVGGVGASFSGNYHIATARHVMRDGNYITTIGVSSSANERASSILNGAPAYNGVSGVMPAIVTNIKDPDGKGRVKVKFMMMAQEEGADLESDWLRLSAPMSGNNSGLLFIPDVNDEVLVAFEGGYPGRGYIIGALWNGSDAVPYSTYHDNGKPNVHGIKMRNNQELQFVNKAGDESVMLRDQQGNIVLLDTKNKILKITAFKDMEIDVTGNLTIKSGGNTTIESKGTFKIDATGAANLESKATVTVKATGQMSVQGASTEVKAQGMLSLSASGVSELKGSLVKIN